MFRTLTARIVIILGVLLVSGASLYQNHREFGSPVRLGLDLQGGMHLVLEVDDPAGTLSPEDRAQAIEQSRRIIRNRVDELGVTEPIIQVVGRDRLIVELAGMDDPDRARELIGRTAMLEWRLVRPTSAVHAALPRIDRAIVAHRAAEAPESSHLQEDAALEGSVRGGGDSRPFTSLLLQAPGEGGFLVAAEDLEEARRLLALPGVQEVLPRGVGLRWGWEPVSVAGRSYRPLYVAQDPAFLTGEMLEDARAERDREFNHALVHFELSRAGGRIFSDVTGRHIGDQLAIVLDG